MKPLNVQIAELIGGGYSSDTAQAKVAHDIVLLAMHRCGFKAHSTVKGGVVMSSMTGDVRRATMDMDKDFIGYSISEASVRRFVSRLAKAMPEVKLAMLGPSVELKHADYRGRRIFLSLKDDSIRRALRTKVDIGVETNNDVAQLDFSFKNNSGEGNADLQANSPEQIFAEKLLSLLRHGASSNRPKDIFDMYYLSGVADKELLKKYIALIIYGNPKCRIDNHAEMMRALRLTFALKTFTRKLTAARANWLQLPGPQVLESLTEYLEGFL